MGGALERALPMALAVFFGVAGGFYTFQPMLAPKEAIGANQDQDHMGSDALKSADDKASDSKADAAKPTS